MSLGQIIASHEARAVSRQVVRPGGEAISQVLKPASKEALFVSVGGTAYPVFILGLNDIDSISPLYYVP